MSGDEAVTNGDKLGGMEFACFPGLKTESRAQRADRKRANLEGQAPHLPSDTKKRTFRSWLAATVASVALLAKAMEPKPDGRRPVSDGTEMAGRGGSLAGPAPP